MSSGQCTPRNTRDQATTTDSAINAAPKRRASRSWHSIRAIATENMLVPWSLGKELSGACSRKVWPMPTTKGRG